MHISGKVVYLKMHLLLHLLTALSEEGITKKGYYGKLLKAILQPSVPEFRWMAVDISVLFGCYMYQIGTLKEYL